MVMNQTSAMFATIPRGLQTAMADRCFVCCDAALYTEENLQQLKHLRWVSRARHPDCCKTLLENMPEEAFNDSALSGYRIAG